MKHSQVTRRVLNTWGTIVLRIQGVLSRVSAAAEVAHVTALYKDVEHCFDKVYTLDAKAEYFRERAQELLKASEVSEARARITEGEATNAHKAALDARAELFLEIDNLS